jgi:hypothetical protein
MGWGGVEGTYLAQGRIRLSAFVNAVMKFRIL